MNISLYFIDQINKLKSVLSEEHYNTLFKNTIILCSIQNERKFGDFNFKKNIEEDELIDMTDKYDIIKKLLEETITEQKKIDINNVLMETHDEYTRLQGEKMNRIKTSFTMCQILDKLLREEKVMNIKKLAKGRCGCIKGQLCTTRKLMDIRDCGNYQAFIKLNPIIDLLYNEDKPVVFTREPKLYEEGEGISCILNYLNFEILNRLVTQSQRETERIYIICSAALNDYTMRNMFHARMQPKETMIDIYHIFRMKEHRILVKHNFDANIWMDNFRSNNSKKSIFTKRSFQVPSNSSETSGEVIGLMGFHSLEEFNSIIDNIQSEEDVQRIIEERKIM